MTNDQAECRSRFALICAGFVSEIDKIDADTPWSETEPDWWLKMMQIRRMCQEVAGAEVGE